MTETEEEAEVAVLRISLAVSSSLAGSPERPPVSSSVRSGGGLFVITLDSCSTFYQVHGDEGDEGLYETVWPQDSTGHHYHHMFTY